MGGCQSLYYRLEKQVSEGMIPKVYQIEGRLKLASMDRGGKDFDHRLWNECLKTHVRDAGATLGVIPNCSTVNYRGLSKDLRFKSYLDQLAAVELTELSAPARLALHMNAYNALCIGLILKHQASATKPIQSINELSTEEQPVWDMPAGVVGGEMLSLNNVEHSKLRATYDEPTLHACIVCASASCPNLRAEAFTVERLNEQMAEQMSLFIAHGEKGLHYDRATNTLTLSRIFLWFRDDFGGDAAVIDAVCRASRDRDLSAALSADRDKVRLRYFAYDWSLNDASAATRLPESVESTLLQKS